MTALWGRDWRKLYRYPSQEWLALPLSVRGLGDELIRVADDDGRVFLGDLEPHVAIARMVGAHPCERRRVKDDVAALVKDRFLVIANGYAVIRNFADAQDAVSPSAHRMRKHRERHADDSQSADAVHPHDSGTTDGVQRDDRRSTDGVHENGASARNDSVPPVTVAQPIDRDREVDRDRDKILSLSGEVAAPARETKPKRQRPQPKSDAVPLHGTEAHRVYAAIVADSVLGPLTVNPGEFATRATLRDAHQCNVLQEVLKAGEWASRQPPSAAPRDGRRFLANWLSRADADAASRPKSSSRVPLLQHPNLHRGPLPAATPEDFAESTFDPDNPKAFFGPARGPALPKVKAAV